MLSEETGGKLAHGTHLDIWKDKDPKHKARSICHWFQQNTVKVLEGPSQSTDLCIIETLGEISSKTTQELKIIGCFLIRRMVNTRYEELNKLLICVVWEVPVVVIIYKALTLV